MDIILAYGLISAGIAIFITIQSYHGFGISLTALLASTGYLALAAVHSSYIAIGLYQGPEQAIAGSTVLLSYTAIFITLFWGLASAQPGGVILTKDGILYQSDKVRFFNWLGKSSSTYFPKYPEIGTRDFNLYLFRKHNLFTFNGNFSYTIATGRLVNIVNFIQNKGPMATSWEVLVIETLHQICHDYLLKKLNELISSIEEPSKLFSIENNQLSQTLLDVLIQSLKDFLPIGVKLTIQDLDNNIDTLSVSSESYLPQEGIMIALLPLEPVE